MTTLPRFEIGTVANDGTGDKPREVGTKLNTAMETLETLLGTSQATAAEASATAAAASEAAAEAAETAASASASAAATSAAAAEAAAASVGDPQPADPRLDDISGIAVTKGNLYAADGTNIVALGVGTDGQALLASSGATTGVAWGTPAPTDASYLTLGTSSALSNERVLTAGTGITLTDAGAGSTLTVTRNTITASDISDASANGQSLISAANYAAMRTLLTLVIGTDVQAYDVDTAKLDVAQNWTAAQRVAPVALTSGTTITMTLAAGNDRTLTLAHNATISNPSDIASYVGQKGSIAGVQDATGGRTLSMGNLWFPIGSASMPAIPSGANDKWRIDYHVVSATRIDFSVSRVGV